MVKIGGFGMSMSPNMVYCYFIKSQLGFTNFNVLRDYCGKSMKIPDGYVQLPDADFSTIVCKAGWSKKHYTLLDDPRGLLLYTNGQT